MQISSFIKRHIFVLTFTLVVCYENVKFIKIYCRQSNIMTERMTGVGVGVGGVITSTGTSSIKRKKIIPTLHSLCQTLIVNNLERYPPEAFSICNDEEWIGIVQLRYKKTQPKNSTSNNREVGCTTTNTFSGFGFDGGGVTSTSTSTSSTGRLVPAISVKFIQSIEDMNSHLRDISIIDQLIWKDCVEYHFKRGGLTRPYILYYPWTILIDIVQRSTNIIVNSVSSSVSSTSTSTSRNAFKTTPSSHDEVITSTCTAKVGGKRKIDYNIESQLPTVPKTLSLSSSVHKKPVVVVDIETIQHAVTTLSQIPMTVSLLRDSGIGKVLKKFLKSFAQSQSTSTSSTSISISSYKVIVQDDTIINTLQSLLSSWMDLAANSGIEMKGYNSTTGSNESAAACATPVSVSVSSSTTTTRKDIDPNDITIAESCNTWRSLYTALKQREDDRRNTQGKRMREIRKNLAATRPKLVKVRPSNKPAPTPSTLASRVFAHSPLFASAAKSSPFASSSHQHHGHATTSSKLQHVKNQASTQNKRLQLPSTTSKSSFADAVAFASGTTKGTKHKEKVTGTSVVQLSNNKRMKIPTQVVKGAGPRSLASKWKKC